MLKMFLRALLVLLVMWFGLGYLGAWLLTRPAETEAFRRKVSTESNYENVTLHSKDGVRINAWLWKGDSAGKAVILLHGIRDDRTAHLERAELYHYKGYTVLLPDFRGSGLSEKATISFGWNERYDVQACYDELQKIGYTSIGVHGNSMGAAAICYSFIPNAQYSFVVLESCYDNIDNALRHRLLNLPHWMYFPLYYFTQKRIGEKASSLDPAAYIKLYKGPLLILAGDKEKQIPVAETEHLYHAAGSENKHLRLFKEGRQCLTISWTSM